MGIPRKRGLSKPGKTWESPELFVKTTVNSESRKDPIKRNQTNDESVAPEYSKRAESPALFVKTTVNSESRKDPIKRNRTYNESVAPEYSKRAE